jgi:hypothetical protein
MTFDASKERYFNQSLKQNIFFNNISIFLNDRNFKISHFIYGDIMKIGSNFVRYKL